MHSKYHSLCDVKYTNAMVILWCTLHSFYWDISSMFYSSINIAQIQGQNNKERSFRKYYIMWILKNYLWFGHICSTFEYIVAWLNLYQSNIILHSCPCIVLNNWSWKRKNATFKTFPVGKQGWYIKGQMLR